MKKVLGLALLIALLLTISVGATETDLELTTPTDLATQTDVIEEPDEGDIDIVVVATVTDATGTDIEQIIKEYVIVKEIVYDGGIPSATDVSSLIEAVKAYLAAIELPEDEAGIGDYFKQVIMPIIFQILTSIAAIYGFAYPIIVKIMNTKKHVDAAAGKFSDAAADVQEAIAEKKAVTDMQNEITALKESTAELVSTIAMLKKENEGMMQEVSDLTIPVKDELTKITNAIKLGMCNTKELVNNGFAARIIKELDGEENVQTENEVDPD